MKDKLRELAEWMRDVNGHCADALTEILDAEGDGGAVAWMREAGNAGAEPCVISTIIRDLWIKAGNAKQVERYTIPLYTHPARSGVVSDDLTTAYQLGKYDGRKASKVNVNTDELRHLAVRLENGSIERRDDRADAARSIVKACAALESYERNRK